MFCDRPRKRYNCDWCGCEVGKKEEAVEHYMSHQPDGDRYGLVADPDEVYEELE